MDTSSRFLAAIDALKSQNLVRSDSQMSFALGFSANYVRFVRKGVSAVQAEALRQIVIKYRVSSHFLFTGDGPMFLTADGSPPNLLAPVGNILTLSTRETSGHLVELVRVAVPAEEWAALYTKYAPA
jgi:hypothetical protein